MLGIEQISRRCLMTFSDGNKIQATIYIPKPTNPSSLSRWNVSSLRVLIIRNFLQ